MFNFPTSIKHARSGCCESSRSDQKAPQHHLNNMVYIENWVGLKTFQYPRKVKIKAYHKKKVVLAMVSFFFFSVRSEYGLGLLSIYAKTPNLK